METSTNLSRVKAYFAALEAGADDAILRSFFADDVIQREYPNRLVAEGATRTLEDLVLAHQRGKKVIEGQRFEIRSAVAEGDNVALEVDWSGILRVALGKLEAGATLRAAFGVFITFRDGKISSQRNYDCFEPF